MPPPPPKLRVRTGPPDQTPELTFTDGFRIGRAPDCEVRLPDDFVSRQHARAVLVDGEWWIEDAGSTNGIVVGGQQVARARVDTTLTVRLGPEGPYVVFEKEKPPTGNVDAYIERYFQDGAGNQPAGEHTMMIREAFSRVTQEKTRKTRWRYGSVIAVLGVLAVLAAGYAYYIYAKTKDQVQIAHELFYSIKNMDVQISRLERVIEASGNAAMQSQILEQRKRRAELHRNYDRFLEAIHAKDAKLNERQRLIVRVARIFGECELDIPPAFMKEVENYIEKWQATPRYSANVKRAIHHDYVTEIQSVFLAQQLPPQFFYLAMQESNFEPFITGPPTRFGRAKGMWQFIPQTGTAYGLKLGPLVEFDRADPADERHDWRKSTRAAAQYIKDLYGTDAQASGLLVMACYNWGEGSVLPLVRSMPANPKDRNFWQLLTKYKDRLPAETYDYVFYIFSAAVIGENPRLFGFDFDSPLRM